MAKAVVKEKPAVRILARTQFKRNGFVLYLVQRGESEPHKVSLVRGRVTGCEDCGSWQYRHTCAHADAVLAYEQEYHS